MNKLLTFSIKILNKILPFSNKNISTLLNRIKPPAPIGNSRMAYYIIYQSNRQQLCFNKMHHTQPQPQTTNSLVFSPQIDDDDFDKGIEKRYFNLLEHESDDSFQNGILVNPRVITLELPNFYEFSRIVGSSNGLLCLAADQPFQDPVYVCNPLTGEFVKLPYCASQDDGIVSAFVFDQVANEYKVIRMSYYHDFSKRTRIGLTTEVYTLGSGEWREVGFTPYILCRRRACQVFVNGALHWLIRSRNLIMTFDVGREEFHVIPLSSRRIPILHSRNALCVRNLGGYLSLVGRNSHRIEIWIMKEYGVKSSWTKECVIPTHGFGGYVTPFKLLKNGNILLRVYTTEKTGDLICYDPVTKTFHHLGVTKYLSEGLHDLLTLARSYVSLKEIVGPTTGPVRHLREVTDLME